MIEREGQREARPEHARSHFAGLGADRQIDGFV
jgi:hypothetical protein